MLAHTLIDRFDVLCFETLNLKGMQNLWGCQINDLALQEFLKILEWVAKKRKNRHLYLVSGIQAPNLLIMAVTS